MRKLPKISDPSFIKNYESEIKFQALFYYLFLPRKLAGQHFFVLSFSVILQWRARHGSKQPSETKKIKKNCLFFPKTFRYQAPSPDQIAVHVIIFLWSLLVYYAWSYLWPSQSLRLLPILIHIWHISRKYGF